MMNRRDFVKTSLLTFSAITFGKSLMPLTAFAGDLPAGKTACTTADPVANALGYVAVAKDIDKKKYKQFAKLAKNHNCAGCALYAGLSGGWGNCTMITNCVVAEKGLCGSWQKKS